MKQLLFSLRLFFFGLFCDACLAVCTDRAEKSILKNKPLNKKLLIKMSNFSHNNLIRWQKLELRLRSNSPDFLP